MRLPAHLEASSLCLTVFSNNSVSHQASLRWLRIGIMGCYDATLRLATWPPNEGAAPGANRAPHGRRR